MWNIIEGFDTLITEYQYNSQDQITMYSHYGSGSPQTFRNSFDYAGRLNNVEFYAGAPDAPNPEYITLAEYSYNENSQVSQQQLNGGGVKTNYYYNNRQWVMEMQESGGLFDFTNDYYKNGNVKSQEILGSYNDNFDNTTDLNFTYTYDKSNRLLETENANQQYKDHFKLENAYDKDGNILELKRYDGDGSVADNFTYTYYSNTNKLQRVTGSGTQYSYDANGNMTRDDINRNRDIKYDHRNLITQLAHTEYILEDSLLYSTYYYYDEAGNRFRKKVYQYIGSQIRDSVEIPDIEEAGDSPGTWELIRDELYSRGADGKELAIYINGNIKQTNIWGLGHEGHITSSDVPNFYLKDHLGSIRIVTNENDEVISAQDYDCWGYLLEGRTYESDESVYKFTGKERDEENQYDYFGARYYDSRIGRWGQVEPLLDKYLQVSPYSYSFDNPLRFLDPNGKDAIPIYYLKYRIEVSGKSIPFIGHAGILLINYKSGETVYYDYGRYGENGKGEVRRQYFDNVLGYKYEGIDETKVSNVLKEISKKFGKGSLIAGAYIESDEFNAMKNYADEYFEYTTSKSSDDEYSLMSNSCATFCYDVIGKDESKQLSLESPLPLDMIRTYRFLYRKVSYDESREEYQIER